MIVIGERINASRKSIREAIGARDDEVIRSEIQRQDKAGADYIDLNAGTGSGSVDDEKRDLCRLVDIALDATAKKIVLDAADPQVIRAAALHLDGRRDWMLNSIKCEEHAAREGLAVVGEFNVPFIALAMGGEGIPPTVEQRLTLCESLLSLMSKENIAPDTVYFDPLVLPVSTDESQPMVTFETIRRIRENFPSSHCTMGLSNVSYGLPKRVFVNSAFLLIALGYGLDSVICDPGNSEISRALVLGALLTGQDRFCRKYSRVVRRGVFDTANKKGVS